jgi:ribonuclease inhibitor
VPLDKSICILHGRDIESLDRLYRELADVLDLPGHFGKNLDALWDVLTTDMAGPVELVWEDSGHSRDTMGSDFDRVISLLREVALERDDFRLTLR